VLTTTLHYGIIVNTIEQLSTCSATIHAK